MQGTVHANVGHRSAFRSETVIGAATELFVVVTVLSLVMYQVFKGPERAMKNRNSFRFFPTCWHTVHVHDCPENACVIKKTEARIVFRSDRTNTDVL